MLCLNMDLNLFIKAQKSSLDWWCHFLAGKYYWMRSHNSKLSVHFGFKKMHACCLLMCGGHRCENLVRKFFSSLRFVNMLKILHKHPQVYWNLYILLVEGLDHDQWTLSLGSLLVQMVVMLFSQILII